MYKSNAKKRELDFNLTIAEFALFWQKPCTYCGTEIHTIGLDRIDSDVGYSIENIVPCCSRCNEMKNNRSTNEWMDDMIRILKHQGILE